MDVTFIIQGPLHSLTAKSIILCSNVGDVIVSCWDTCDQSLLIDASCACAPYTLVVTAAPNINNFSSIRQVFDPANLNGVFYQMISVYKAFDVPIRTRFCVKLRSDEFYSDFSKMMARLHETPDVLISTNLFAMSHSLWKYHISDHVFGCKTETMRSMFKHIYDIVFFENEKRLIEFQQYIPDQIDCIHPEQLIGIAFKYVTRSLSPISCDLSAENIIIIPCEDLGHFIVSFIYDSVRTHSSNKDLPFMTLKNTQDFLGEPPTLIKELYNTRLGQYYFLRNKWNESRECFEKVRPELRTCEIWLNIGVNLCHEQKYEEAIVCFTKASSSSVTTTKDQAIANLNTLEKYLNVS